MKYEKSYKNRLLAILLIIAIVMTSIPAQNVYAAQKKTVIVTTQKSLEKALKNKKVTQITIKTSKATTFKIKKGNYTSKKLIVNASKAKINNYAKMKSITVKDAKKYMEYASNNNILVEDKSLTIGVEKGATVKHLNVKAQNAKNTIVIKGTVDKLSVSAKKEKLTISNSGTITKMNISQLADISIKGTSKEAINVTTSANAKNTILKSSVLVSILAKANINIQLNKGAESSTVTMKNKANAVIKNKTKEIIMIEIADGEKVSVNTGETLDTEKLNSENTSSTFIPLTAISVYVKNGENATALEGNQLGLEAILSPVNATNKEVVWSSSDNRIATVDGTGLVTAVAAGQVTIIATSTANGTIVGNITVTVEAKEEIKEETKEEVKEETKEEAKEEVKEEIKEEITLTKITISVKEGGSKLGTDTLLEEGNTLTLTATVMPESASQAIMWYCFDTNVATIDENGLVTGVKEGEATIAAMSTKDSSVIAYFKLMVVGKSSSTDNEAGRFQLAKETAESIIRQQGIDTLGTDVEKIKAVHDYLVLNAAYDYSNYQNNTIPEVSYEAYGVIILKAGVCDSYRKAFQLFMDILGIPCEGVTGTGNGGAHAWNIVTLDGERYHIDVTWDDPAPNIPGYVQYDYFLVDDATMKQDHTWDYSSVQPCNGTKYRTYPYEATGQLAQTKEEVYALIRKQYAEGTPEQFDIKILAKADVLASYYEINEYLWKEVGVTGTLWNYPSIQVGDYYYHHVFKKVGE